eukprot:snap_masked-scaffold_16-processed-gene-6.56-mRNA-1 protein AED:1.00 eAED:1.00 QI:0/-1/0/0/-1/1/1/0/72
MKNNWSSILTGSSALADVILLNYSYMVNCDMRYLLKSLKQSLELKRSKAILFEKAGTESGFDGEKLRGIALL